MSSNYKGLLVFLRSPQVIILIISLILLAFNIIYIGHIRPFNSDDLYWQQAVRTWTPFNGETLYLATKNNFIENVPFFVLFEHLFSPTRKLLIAEVGILTMTSFTLCYVSTLYFLKKLKIKPSILILLPFVWLASFGYPLVQNYLNADWRSFEIGFSFLTYMFTAAYLFKDINPFNSIWSKILSVFATMLIGILIYSDPYFLFFTIGPIVIFSAVLFLLKIIHRSQLITVYIGVALSLIFAKVTSLILAKAGIVYVAEVLSSFVSFDDILTNIIAALHGLLIIFGGDFFGKPTSSISTFGAMLNAAILLVILTAAYRFNRTLLRANKNQVTLPKLWMAYFSWVIGFIFVIYTSSTLAAVNNYRYFILLVYVAVVFLIMYLGKTNNSKLKQVVGIMLIAATTFNIAYTGLSDMVDNQPDVKGNVNNVLNFKIINAVEDAGLTKGYANYWQGNVNTYLSGGRIVFLPVICKPEATTSPFKWLIEGGLYERKAQKTFYIVDPDRYAPPSCTLPQLKAQFGEPIKIINIENKSILIFDYDILTKMPKELLTF